MFKDLGISDTQIAFWTSVIMFTVDIKVPLESFFRNVSYEKIFRCRHSVTEWVIIRYSSSLIELRLFFRDQCLTMAVIAEWSRMI